VNKAELIQALAEHYDGNKADAAKALNAVVQTITYQAAAGEKVSITGFGVFEKISRGERMVRNPRTGERKLAEPTAVPRFRAGTDLKAYVSGAKPLPSTAAPMQAAARPAAKVTRVEKSVAAAPDPGSASNGKRSDGKRSDKKADSKKADSKKTASKETASTKTTSKETGAKKTVAKKTVDKKAATKGAGRKAAAKS